MVIDVNGLKLGKGDVVAPISGDFKGKVCAVKTEEDQGFVCVRVAHRPYSKGVWYASEHVQRLQVAKPPTPPGQAAAAKPHRKPMGSKAAAPTAKAKKADGKTAAKPTSRTASESRSAPAKKTKTTKKKTSKARSTKSATTTKKKTGGSSRARSGRPTAKKTSSRR